MATCKGWLDIWEEWTMDAMAPSRVKLASPVRAVPAGYLGAISASQG
jgi:hypothetical protein